jgi:spermidine/putrescine transport system ATP-binding protein
MQIELKSIQRTTGKTFIFVTHDQEEALTMSDVIVVMNAGRIEQMGDPHTLYAKPRSRFVANFIGETNFIEGRLQAVNGGLAAIEWNDSIVHASLNGHAPVVGSTVAAAIRPEAISVQSQKPANSLAVSGRITQRIFKGDHTSLTISLANGQSVVAQLDPVALSGIESDDVWLTWRESDAVVLAD